MNKERKKLINSVHDNINDILIEDRIKILNMIQDVVDIEDLYEEGTGIRLLYSNLSDSYLKKINDFIIEAKVKTHINLDE